MRLLADAAADADLLVVGSRGYGPLRRVLLGSTSAGLVRSARCPVLVYPRAIRAWAEPGPHVTRTLARASSGCMPTALTSTSCTRKRRIHAVSTRGGPAGQPLFLEARELGATAGARVRSVPTEPGILDTERCERRAAPRAFCEVGLAHSVSMDEPLRPAVRTQKSPLHSSTVTRIRRSAVRSRPRLESAESREAQPLRSSGLRLGCAIHR